ncbi:MAG TPA: hypothetical protein VFI73_14300 [Candidatus Nitrosopolaris sp.]|nr:hypothetical protein [Candidatus Nitrosopolaris sp.]
MQQRLQQQIPPVKTTSLHGVDYALIKFEVADDLANWSAEIPGKVLAGAEASTGPMTSPGKRVQTTATWGKSLVDEADSMGFKWEKKVSQASIFDLNGMDHESSIVITPNINLDLQLKTSLS